MNSIHSLYDNFEYFFFKFSVLNARREFWVDPHNQDLPSNIDEYEPEDYDEDGQETDYSELSHV